MNVGLSPSVSPSPSLRLFLVTCESHHASVAASVVRGANEGAAGIIRDFVRLKFFSSSFTIIFM